MQAFMCICTKISITHCGDKYLKSMLLLSMIHLSIHLSIYLHTQRYAYIYMYVCVNIYVCVRISMYAYVCVFEFLRVCTCNFVSTFSFECFGVQICLRNKAKQQLSCGAILKTRQMSKSWPLYARSTLRSLHKCQVCYAKEP